MKSKMYSFRIPDAVGARLAKATDRAKDPLAPTATQVLLMGLDRALKQIETKTARARRRAPMKIAAE